MKLRTFLLDEWLERYEGKTRYHLAASTGPGWTLDDLRRLMTAEENERLLKTHLTYQPGHGTESLRQELAAMYGAKAEEIQIVTGASEALLALFFLAAAPAILGDFSKAFSLSGIRVGWILERDPKRREDYWNARAHFSISNNFPGELLAEVAVRNREKIFDRAREVSASNLRTLDRFFREHREILGGVRPEGGMTGFPWLVSGENARPFCEAAGSKRVLLAPGGCVGFPPHSRPV